MESNQGRVVKILYVLHRLNRSEFPSKVELSKICHTKTNQNKLLVFDLCRIDTDNFSLTYGILIRNCI